MSTIRISGISCYPVKAMRGIPLSSAILGPQGLEHDRKWLIVDHENRFMTQRQIAGLALIVPTLEQDGLVLCNPQGQTISVPYEVQAGEQLRTNVWGDECQVIDQGEEISVWLSKSLETEQPLRLVRMQANTERAQSKPDLLGADTRVLFADAAPLLVANEASLLQINNALEAKGESPVPMNRFRPNIVLAGLAAFAEHTVAGLVGHNFRLEFSMPCERCVVTTIDQETAQRHPAGEPFKTVREINSSPSEVKKPVFGHYANLSDGTNPRIALGDEVRLLD